MTEKHDFARYLNVHTANSASFSPDGERLSFLTDITGVAEVWSVPIDIQAQHAAWPEQLTFRGERVSSAVFSPTEDTLLISGDVGGNERTQLYTLSGDGAEFTSLTSQPDAMYLFGGWSPDGTRITYSSNERDVRFFDVYERHLASGTTRLLLQSDHTNWVRNFSPDGQQVLVERTTAYYTRNQLILVDTTTGEARILTPEINEGTADHSAAAWSADRKGLYLLSTRGRNYRSLAYLDLATTEMTYLREADWDAEQLAITADGATMALVTNEDGYSKLELFDVSQGWETRQELLGPTLPHGIIYHMAWSQDDSKLAITYMTANDATDIWVWDTRGGMVKRMTRSATGGIPTEAFVEPEVVHYSSFDGRAIPAFLYLPHGEQSNLPIVINVHGGPEGQARPWFNPIIQYLVGRGYGVLDPNVRGSIGYGYEYQSLDDVRLRMDSVADLQHAALWLCESGIADPRRIAVMGGSYGGFMVLSAITTYPDLWAAAVDIVGVANFVTFLENTGPWRRKLREAEYGSLEHDRAFLERISPIHAVDRISAPLFVVHGANDPRVPVGEAEQIVSALRAREVPVEYLRFEDEGHGLVKRANRLVAYPAIARFLDRHLGVKA
ncbi:MAG TPA: S9 family peptidase [Ktedonosporobacter sp.]|nr:S9 family peptidase [Ktedonosporobacter sp.]